jgi:hypothetical protein
MHLISARPSTGTLNSSSDSKILLTSLPGEYVGKMGGSVLPSCSPAKRNTRVNVSVLKQYLLCNSKHTSHYLNTMFIHTYNKVSTLTLIIAIRKYYNNLIITIIQNVICNDETGSI